MSDGPRRTWAPFVGAALAALTAGSLVVFALVAQRTSLDGFPELRIAAPADAATGRPASITVAPVDGNAGVSREVASNDETESGEVAELTQPVTAPLTLIPLVPATATSGPLDLASLDSPAGASLSASGDRRPQGDDKANFDGRFRADGELLAARRDGGSGGAAQAGASNDSRRGAKEAGKSRDAKAKKNKKNKKNNKQKRSNHGTTTHRRSRGRAHAQGSQGRSHAAAPSASRSSGSRSDSRQAAAPRPKPSSQPSPQGPPAHSNAGGNGKSNGKGHKKR